MHLKYFNVKHIIIQDTPCAIFIDSREIITLVTPCVPDTRKQSGHPCLTRLTEHHPPESYIFLHFTVS